MKKSSDEKSHQFIEQFNFATLICHGDSGLIVSHMPVILNREQGEHGTLSWHLAKQNPQSNMLDGDKTALCIFHGPHSYISTEWYASSPNVPTWNYAVVHAHGNPKQVSDEQLETDLSQIVKKHEGNNGYLIPDHYKMKLMRHIVGFSMEITQIEARFKLGLERSQEDLDGMLAGLQKINNNGLALAEFMQLVQEEALC